MTQRLRRPVAVAVAAALLLLAGGGVAVGWQQRQVADRWRDRALQHADERDEAMGRVQAMQRQLEEAVAAVRTSETDVTALEDRLTELADEKAQAEDTATTVQVQRDAVVDLSQKVAASVSSLDQCVTRLFALQRESVEAFNRLAAGQHVEINHLNGSLEGTTAFCDDARTAAAQASAAARALPR